MPAARRIVPARTAAHRPCTETSWLAYLVEAAERIRAAALDPAELAWELVRSATNIADATCQVLLVDGDGLARYATAVTHGPSIIAQVEQADPHCRRAMLTGRALQIEELTGDPAGVDLVYAQWFGFDVRSALIVPLVDVEVVLGVVVCASPNRGHFGLDEEHAVRLLAGAAAGALVSTLAVGLPLDEGPLDEGPLDGDHRADRDPADADRPTARRPDQGGRASWGGTSEPMTGSIEDSGLHAAHALTGLGTWQFRPTSSLREAAGPSPDHAAPEGDLIWSTQMCRLAAVDPDEFRPSVARWRRMVHPDDLPRLLRVLTPEPGAPPVVELLRWRPLPGDQGTERHVQAWSTAGEVPVVEPHPGPRSIVVYGAALDVTEHQRDRALLHRLSITDPVTGLGNRMALDTWLAESLSAVRPDVALLLVDLDRFKLVNDTLGHQVGDRLLAEVGQRLRRAIPAEAKVCRMGGDEFAVLLPHVPVHAAQEIGVQILASLREPLEVSDSGEVLVCPGSLGMAVAAARRVTPGDLLGEADLALYRAKDSGRDRVVLYDDALRARARNRHRIERMLRSAITDGRLTLQYQPVIDFAHGRVIGAEALVRVHDAYGGHLLTPDTFIAVAENTGLIVDIDCWVIGTALAQLARWARLDRGRRCLPWLSLNLSARSLDHPKVGEQLTRTLQQLSLDPGLLKVELTERSFLKALPTGEETLRQWTGSGVNVGIDDFGTGYSALAYLERFPLQFMKIDRSFIAAVGVEERADAVATAIVDLAHAHGMTVIAEGVETSRQARRLREIGCDQGQGHHFGRPGDPQRIIKA